MNKFLLLVLSPAFLFVIYDALFYLAWIPFGGYSEMTANLMVVYFFINLIIFFITWFKINSIPNEKLKPTVAYRSSISPSVALILIMIGLYSLFMQIGGSLSFNLEDTYNEIQSRGIFYIVINQVVTYILIYDIYVGKPRLLFTLIVALYVFSSAITGGRSGVILQIILILFIFSMKKRINFSKILLTAVLLIIFFVVGSFLRGTMDLSGDGGIVGFLDFNQIFTLEETLKYNEINGGQFMLFLKDVLDGFVPRVINSDKNTSTAFTREIFPDVGSTTSYTSGFYANLLFVLGYAGLLMAPIIQIAITFIYIKMVEKGQNSPANFLVIFFLVFPLMIVRGGIFEFRVVFALFLVLFSVFAHRLLRKKIVFSRQRLRGSTCLKF